MKNFLADINNTNNIIVIDAMGGDFAPDEIIKGAMEAANEQNLKIIFSGKKEKIIEVFKNNQIDFQNIDIINSVDDIAMDESPSEILRYKKNSSIYLGTQKVSELKNSAFLSAGNTGAVLACSLFNIKKIDGILRPAIAVVIPLGDKRFILIDAGANTEIKPIYLAQFALMGNIYSKEIFKVEKPKVGLLNIGSEEKKGTEAVIQAYQMIKNLNLNFIGNIEGRDIFEGIADVVVCDGFVGNILLKSIEGMASFFFNEIKKLLLQNFFTKLTALGLKKYLKQMKQKFNYEQYGGALLLGINGIVVISHGSSKAFAIKNAIKLAAESLKNDIINKITLQIKNFV